MALTDVVRTAPVEGSTQHLRRNLPSLTSMRWFAALAVFGVHLGLAGTAGHLLSPGVAGVSFFYLLSGFVLTWSAAGAARSSDRASRFYLRRFARIYPTHLVAWLLALVFVAFGMYSFGTRPFTLGLFLLQAWSPNPSDYYGGNGLAWSLSCEMFFYAMFPLVLRLLRRCSNRVMLTVGAVAFAAMAALNVCAWVMGDADAIRSDRSLWVWLVYIFPPTRFLEFLLGCILAMLVHRCRRFPVPAFVAVPVAAVAYWLTTLAPAPQVATAVTALPFLLLVGAFAMRDVRGDWSVLTARWLVVLGQWSFAFYLVHQMMLRWVADLAYDGTLPISTQWVTLAAARLAVAIAAAALMHYLVERPCERWIRAFSDRRTPGLIAPV